MQFQTLRHRNASNSMVSSMCFDGFPWFFMVSAMFSMRFDRFLQLFLRPPT